MSVALSIVWIVMMGATLTLTIITNRRIKKANKSVGEANARMDLLSRENTKLRTENEVYKDKLKNMGFTDAHLKI